MLGFLLLLSSVGPATAQTWDRSFSAGKEDVFGKYMGGSEVLHLVGHRGSLFAAVGYWQDARNVWYGGSDWRTGWGQVLRLDSHDGEWVVDLEMGPMHLRPEILKELTFSTDGVGAKLRKPATLLVAIAYAPGLSKVAVNAFTRNLKGKSWVKARILSGPKPGGENYSVRDLHVHRDQITGVDRVFVTIGTKGVFSGVYDPHVAGEIRWDAKPELGPLKVRPLGMTSANGSLFVSSGSQLYRRTDGKDPSYAVVHDLSDRARFVNSAVGGIRGLTTVANPSGPGDALLFMWSPGSRSQGLIFRLEPQANGAYTRHREVVLADLMCKRLGVAKMTYVLGAYNDFLAYVDPQTGETRHIVGFEGKARGRSYPSWGDGYYRGAMYAIRDRMQRYRLEEVNGKTLAASPALVSTRCYALSPFDNERAIYFGGHDPNGTISTNMAWIYRKTLPKAAGGRQRK